jgi:hypothetical protein
MQVIILEYVVPRVLEYPCVKFGRVSMSKTWLIDILPSGSILTRHIRPMAEQGQTYPVQGLDIPSLSGLFTLLSVDSSWVPHRAFTSWFFLHSCLVLTHVWYYWRKWLVVMSVARSIVRMLVLPLVVPLPSPRSLPRDHDPAATRRSPPLGSLHLVVILPMRRSASRCIL